MPSTNLGKVSVTPKGEWSASAAYEILDIVAKDGSSYLALTSVPSGTALSNTSYWLLIAEKGDKGDTGEISGASASISGGYGTPSVSVTEGGTSTDRSFAFAFSNLVGDGIASIAVEKTDTSGAVDTYTMTITMDSGDTETATWTVTNGSVTSVNGRTGAVTGLAEEDGYYEEMSVGSADQLISSVCVEDSVPYTFRTSGGSADIGDRDFEDAVVGGSIAWNQLIYNGNFASTDGWGTTSGVSVSVSNNKLTATQTTSSYFGVQLKSEKRFNAISGHKYLLSLWLSSSSGNANLVPTGSASVAQKSISGATSDTLVTWIWNASSTTECSASIRFLVTTNGTSEELTGTIHDCCFFDLTQMFGSTIADYIYGLEQNNSGSGVAWFKSLFPKPYYAYNSGTLIHVNASAHETTGFNQWDEEWELGGVNVTTGGNWETSDRIRSKNKIKVVPNTTYNAYSGSGCFGRVCYYDASENFVGYQNYSNSASVHNASITTPADVYFIRFDTTASYGTTYKNDICINLHWDGERDGEYEEYVKHTYALDSDLTLRGIPKLDANNKLYWDGDRYANDGTVERRYGIVDLGTLAWNGSASIYYAVISDKVNTRDNYGICSAYVGVNDVASSMNDASNKLSDKSFIMSKNTSNPYVYVEDSAYANKDLFKASLDGVYLVYELATPTEESADAYVSPQIIDDFGTEWFTVTEQSGVAMPVGHESRYTNNLRAKLEMSPESPSGEGDYIVRQENGENTYVPLVIPSELPTAPSTDGNYLLKCVVADGTATYSWEAQT